MRQQYYPQLISREPPSASTMGVHLRLYADALTEETANTARSHHSFCNKNDHNSGLLRYVKTQTVRKWESRKTSYI